MSTPRTNVFPEGLRPSPSDAIDSACAVALTLLGVVGFRTAFGGSAYLVVGALGAVAGAAVGFLLARARMPVLISTAAGIAGFFVTGSIVLRQEAIAGVVPTPAGLVALLDGVVNGWAKLLTAVPPVGSGGDLLVIPLLCGFAGALVSVVLAVLVPRLHVCVLAPMVVLALSVLFGVHEPASLLLQGGVFGAVAIGWMSYRESRKRRAIVDTGRVRRQAVAAGLLAVSAASALVLGPNLPLAGSHQRFVLRDRNEPPFDPSQLPSPLVSFRRYVDDKGSQLKDTVLFTVTAGAGTALPEGVRIRLAVMDEFDGVVWAVGGGGSQIGGRFERVGDDIESGAGFRPGPQQLDLRFETKVVGTRPGVWMPIAGVVRDVQFDGPRQAELEESFRFNRLAGSAAVPIALKPGDAYRLTTRLAREATPEEIGTRPAAGFTSSTPLRLPDIVREIADRRTQGATDVRAKAAQLEAWLKDGFYSDGGEGSAVAPGHSLGRLVQFLDTDQPTGNAEQYAAGMAVLARSLGLPARVVMGFAVPAGTTGPTAELRGRDVDAWVEIAFDGIGWVGFHPTPDKSRVPSPDARTRPQPRREEASVDAPPPPPSTVPPPAADFDNPDDPTTKKKRPSDDGLGNGVPRLLILGASVAGVPALAILLFAGVVVAYKARRHRRRRATGTPADRIAGAWSELVDHARDLGQPVPKRATRMELTPFLTVPASTDIARAADAALFGPTEPTDAEAEELWRQVDAALDAAVAPLPRTSRARAAVNLTSLRPG